MVWLALLALLPRAGRAQCPDGTPPPCARPGRVAAATPASSSLAVLYFDNLSADSSDAYLADGLTEEIILRLGAVERLTVKSRSAVRRYRGAADLDPAAVGRTLGVAHLVNGSVRRAGNRLRVTVELVRAADGTRVWGEAFDRRGGDLLSVEEDVARAVAEAITGRLLPAERSSIRARPTRNSVAYDFYLRGRFAADRFTEPDFRRAIELYRQALEEDPRFALAYAGIAQAWAELADDWLAPGEAYPRSRQAAERALALDSTLGEAHSALAQYLLLYERDFAGAEREYRRAAALNPRDPDPHHQMARGLAARGRMSEAFAEAQRAVVLDPYQLAAGFQLARILLWARQFDRAAAQARQTLALDPSHARTSFVLGEALLAMGADSAALATLRRTHELRHSSQADSRLARALALTGHQVEARALLDSLVALEPERYVSPDFIAAVYAALGEPDRAFLWLNRAEERRAAPLNWLAVNPDWDPIRSDPRLAALLRRLGLE